MFVIVIDRKKSFEKYRKIYTCDGNSKQYASISTWNNKCSISFYYRFIKTWNAGGIELLNLYVDDCDWIPNQMNQPKAEIWTIFWRIKIHSAMQ